MNAILNADPSGPVSELYKSQIAMLDEWELAQRSTTLRSRLQIIRAERAAIEQELGHIAERYETDESVQTPD